MPTPTVRPTDAQPAEISSRASTRVAADAPARVSAGTATQAPARATVHTASAPTRCAHRPPPAVHPFTWRDRLIFTVIALLFASFAASAVLTTIVAVRADRVMRDRHPFQVFPDPTDPLDPNYKPAAAPPADLLAAAARQRHAELGAARPPVVSSTKAINADSAVPTISGGVVR